MIVLLLALACGLGATTIALSEIRERRRTITLERVTAYGRVEQVAVEAGAGRTRGRAADTLARAVLRFVPGRNRAATAAQLQAAGLSRVRPEAFLAVKAVFLLGGLLLAVTITPAAGPVGILLGLTIGAIGYAAPDIVLRSRIRRRQERIVVDLPDALDLLAVIVEAGLGLDAALIRYAERTEGPLAEEMALLTAELRVGSSRKEVFRRLAERVPAPEMRSFVRAIVHADRLGTSLTGVLRTQSEDVRRRRRLAAEERAGRMPVKILFPMVFCIFPVLLLVVVGPQLFTLVQNGL